MPWEGVAARVIDQTGWTLDYVEQIDASKLIALLQAFEGMELARGKPHLPTGRRMRKWHRR